MVRFISKDYLEVFSRAKKLSVVGFDNIVVDSVTKFLPGSDV